MDAERARVVQVLLAGTAWAERTRDFGRALRFAGHGHGGLLVIGTPREEPWHLTAHLDDEARWSEIPELTPTLLRQHPPSGADAPSHLRIDLERLAAAGRGETLLVVAPHEVPPGLLERFEDARRRGVTVLALEAGSRDLRGLAHQVLTVVDADAESDASESDAALWSSRALRPDGLIVPWIAGLAFETAQHLVTVAAGEQIIPVGRRRGFRDRLGRFLDRVTGLPDGCEDEAATSALAR
ncbi:hypothetical protein [Actinopolymorpha pittospori]